MSENCPWGEENKLVRDNRRRERRRVSVGLSLEEREKVNEGQ